MGMSLYGVARYSVAIFKHAFQLVNNGRLCFAFSCRIGFVILQLTRLFSGGLLSVTLGTCMVPNQIERRLLNSPTPHVGYASSVVYRDYWDGRTLVGYYYSSSSAAETKHISLKDSVLSMALLRLAKDNFVNLRR